MATLVGFWKVRCSQEVTKTTVFTEGDFNRKCQSHVWFWFCSRGMFTQRLRKLTGFTEGMRTASVEYNVCLCFHRCGMFGTGCLSGKFNRNENVDVFSVFRQRDEVQETLHAAVFIQNFCSHSQFSVTACHLIPQPRCQPRCQRSRASNPV